MAAELPDKQFADAAAFEKWLAKNHASSPGIWLLLAKKGGGGKSPTYVEAVEVALCYGWIDSQKTKLDERYSRQRLTPRGPRSRWSKINVDRVVALTKAGRMQPAGLAEVERAKADGLWAAAYASQSNATVPEDFAAALATHPKAKELFDTISASNRYAMLYRIDEAKKPETRAARIEKFVAMLAEGKSLY